MMYLKKPRLRGHKLGKVFRSDRDAFIPDSHVATRVAERLVGSEGHHRRGALRGGVQPEQKHPGIGKRQDAARSKDFIQEEGR